MTERGLTPFLVGMVKASDGALAQARANAAKVAKHHGISEDVVRFNLSFWRA